MNLYQQKLRCICLTNQIRLEWPNQKQNIINDALIWFSYWFFALIILIFEILFCGNDCFVILKDRRYKLCIWWNISFIFSCLCNLYSSNSFAKQCLNRRLVQKILLKIWIDFNLVCSCLLSLSLSPSTKEEKGSISKYRLVFRIYVSLFLCVYVFECCYKEWSNVTIQSKCDNFVISFVYACVQMENNVFSKEWKSCCCLFDWLKMNIISVVFSCSLCHFQRIRILFYIFLIGSISLLIILPCLSLILFIDLNNIFVTCVV